MDAEQDTLEDEGIPHCTRHHVVVGSRLEVCVRFLTTRARASSLRWSLEAQLSQTIQNRTPKQFPNKTCEIHFYLLCQILSTVVQDIVSRNDRFNHR